MQEEAIEQLLFEPEFNENEYYDYNLIRNECDFNNFLYTLSNKKEETKEEKPEKNEEKPEKNEEKPQKTEEKADNIGEIKGNLKPKSVSFSFMAKKWMLNFLKNLNNSLISHNSFSNLQKLRISNSNIPSQPLFELLKSLNSSLIDLNLSSNPVTISDEILHELMNFESLSNLHSLTLKNNKKITDKSLEFLSQKTVFHLKSLNLSNCSITDQGLKNLSQNLPKDLLPNSQNFSELKVLNLSRNHEISSFDVIKLPKLEVLELSYCKLTSDFAINLIKSQMNSSLKSLNISHLAIYDPRSVFKSILSVFIKEKAVFQRMEKIAIENVCIEDGDLAQFLQLFPNLKAINLNNNKFLTNKALSIISEIIRKIRVLSIENCQLSPNISEKGDISFENLSYLNVNNNPLLSDKGLFRLLSGISMNLRYLFCANCEITKELAIFLKKNEEKYQELRYLNLRGNTAFQNNGVFELQKCGFFHKLFLLNITDCNLDDRTVEILQEFKPKGGYFLKDLRLAQNRIGSEALARLFRDFQQDFKGLERVAMGSHECLDDFEGKKEMERKGIVVVPLIGDSFD